MAGTGCDRSLRFRMIGVTVELLGEIAFLCFIVSRLAFFIERTVTSAIAGLLITRLDPLRMSWSPRSIRFGFSSRMWNGILWRERGANISATLWYSGPVDAREEFCHRSMSEISKAFEEVRLIAPMSFTSATDRQRFPSNDCFVRRR